MVVVLVSTDESARIELWVILHQLLRWSISSLDGLVQAVANGINGIRGMYVVIGRLIWSLGTEYFKCENELQVMNSVLPNLRPIRRSVP